MSILIWRLSFGVLITLILLAIPVFFLSRKLLIKWSDTANRLGVVLITFGTTLCIYISIVFALNALGWYYPDKYFDKESWERDWDSRFQMAEDITQSKMLMGKTFSEVQIILGKSMSEPNDPIWRYYLGEPHCFLCLDPAILFVTFKEGRVHKVSYSEG